MGVLAWAQYAILHPLEFRSLVSYKLWHEPKRDITATKEHATSGWDRATMRRCWDFLDMTSRSFAAVIKELDGDLARTICLFYLALRGLDTIEDDMTIPDDIKQPLLRSFYLKLSEKGWNFNGSGPDEKDRQLLVEYDSFIEEMCLIKPEYNAVITDIARKMGNGMADFAHQAASSSTPLTLETIQDYDLYCHYVAGLVGEGLSRLFAASGKEAPWIADQLTLSNSTGFLLQKTNILRDFREDCDQNRYFWPKEIWGQHGFTEITQLKDPKRRQQAMWALSGMTADALRHATDALDYLTFLRNQSIFNFVAIPAVMAIATLELCFMNEKVFESHIKIRKGLAVQLIMRSTNPRDVAYMFRDFSRRLHAKAVPSDPSYIKISIACGQIETWTEHHYPTFVEVTVSEATGKPDVQYKQSDSRMRIVNHEIRREQFKELDKLKENGNPVEKPTQESLPLSLIFFVLAGVILVMGGSAAAVLGVAHYYDVWSWKS